MTKPFLAFTDALYYPYKMTREEFEKILTEVETLARKKLPAMINIALINKGNQDQERTFQQFMDKLQRYRKALLKELERVARPAQKVRYFNVTYSIDAQLRSMAKRDEFQKFTRLKQHKAEIHVTYDIGSGPREGKILNVLGGELLLSTDDTIPTNHEIELSFAQKSAKGKTTWSAPTPNAHIETGVRLGNGAADLVKEVESLLKAIEKEIK
jgi:hypothetical protein